MTSAVTGYPYEVSKDLQTSEARLTPPKSLKNTYFVDQVVDREFPPMHRQIRFYFAYTRRMGGERASTARQRLSGKICCMCKSSLPAPHTPGEQVCAKCNAERSPRRRVYMSFMLQHGWYCQFLEADLKTSLPKKLSLPDEAKIFELAERGGGMKNLEARHAIQHGIEIGRGGFWLELTDEQYQKLRKR
jgi:hypothetical protein